MLPYIVALTGGIGSGKSSAADIFRALGALVVDTDEISHQLTAPGAAGTEAIRRGFGPQHIRPDGALDCTHMRELVFSDPQAKKALESILHPLIRAAVREQLMAVEPDTPYAILAVPLLVETGAYRDLVRRVLVIDCKEEIQVARVIKRSALTEPQIRAIMANQATREQRLKQADDVVTNDSDLESLREQVVALHHSYKRLADAA